MNPLLPFSNRFWSLDSKKGPYQPAWTVFWVALAVRLLYITLAHSYRLRTFGNHFPFGYEMGRIARALVTGRGYADPFIGHTGPTAWVTPLYPLLLAGVFKLLGVYSLRSAWTILAINSIFSALTTLTTYEMAARCFNRRVALWSAWIWALYPAAMQYAVRWVWEMTLSTWLLSCIFVLCLRMKNIGALQNIQNDHHANEDGATPRQWLLFGFLWGMLALSNSSLLLFLPASGLWVIHGSRHRKRATAWAASSLLVCLLCISPWMARNALVFHRFIPMRSNFGAESYLGNGPGARGFLMEYDHPYESPVQMRLYRTMGEVAYCRMRGRKAWQFVKSDPALFIRNSLKRVYFFWVSVPAPSNRHWYTEPVRVANYSFTSLAGLLGLFLALKRRRPAASLFAWTFLLVPLLYYFVTVHARFRHPIEPLIDVLGVYLFQSAQKGRFQWKAVTG